jgi:hypothetical protein
MYLIHGAHWFVDRKNRFHALGKDYPEALKRYAGLVEGDAADDTVGALIGRYENEILPKRAKVTARGRKQEFKRIRKVFGAMSPKDLRAADAWQYFQDAGETQQARHEIRALSAAMGWGVKWGVIERNPFTNLQFPKTKPRTRYVTDAEFVAVRGIAPVMVRTAMNIALITALRQADILGLERRQIVGGTLTVEASKTGKRATFPVAGELEDCIAAALREPPQLRQAVIANRRGRRYTRDGFQSQWQRLIKKALRLGLIAERFTFHDIRAKNLSDEVSLEEARKRAQHSDARITESVYRRLPTATSVADIGRLKG